MSTEPPGRGDPPPAVGPEAAPPWPYALALAALAALGAAFGLIARAARRADPGHLDRRVSDWIGAHQGRWHGATRFFHAITRLGNLEIAVPLVLMVALALVVLRRRGAPGIGRGEAPFWLGVLAGGWLLEVALKLLFHRERPPLDLRLVAVHSYSFPSGHSQFAAVFFAMLATLGARVLRGPHARWRTPAIAACLTLAMLVAASRVWLGVHYVTDVLGGLSLGLAWVVAAWMIRSHRAARKARRAGRAPVPGR